MGQAAKLFWDATPEKESLLKRIAPSPQDLEYLQQMWNPLGDFVLEDLRNYWSGSVSSWLQGSYKYGTLLKPLDLNDEYDVDLGVYLEYESGDEHALPRPADLKRRVHQALTRYRDTTADAKEVPDEKERCSRIVFDNNFHVDVPSYRLSVTKDLRRLATKSDDWENSDPKAIYIWFRSVVPEEKGDQLRRLIRYMKAWSKMTFNRFSESRPSSILLTVIVAEAYRTLTVPQCNHDDEALTSVLRLILDRIATSSEIKNPVNAAENLNRMNHAAFEGFVNKLEEFLNIAEDALLKPNILLAAVKWAEAFKHLFPLPDNTEIAAEKFAITIPAPNIRIHASDRRTGRALGTFENAVPQIQANANLTFTITNPEFIPSNAKIEWTVRNSQGHATEKHDLGHTSTYEGGITNTEHTAYRGKHFMDCLVRQNGQVVSLRRVPVSVLANWQQKPRRNPPKPGWVKLRKGRRR